MWKVQLFRLNFDEQEIRAVSEVIASGWITMGSRVLAFEQAFAEMLSPKDPTGVHCLAVNNCTAALLMAVMALELKPGDEVIVPGLTFVADANVVRLIGAVPVFADCSSVTDLNISPEDIERKISERTKAVMVVHYAGYPCNMAAITAICSKHGIPLIEDVAHAPGATYQGQGLGTFGDIACFSFFTNKNLSTGEGGLVATRNPEYLTRLKALRSHGMTTLTLDRHEGRAFSYDVLQPGGNFRMDEIHAALGQVQLAKLTNANLLREGHTHRYRQILESSSLHLPFTAKSDEKPAYHILPTLLPEGVDRVRFMEGMKRQGIQTSIHYPPFWQFTAYEDVDSQAMPVLQSIASRQVTLPLYPGMTTFDIDAVCHAVASSLAAA